MKNIQTFKQQILFTIDGESCFWWGFAFGITLKSSLLSKVLQIFLILLFNVLSNLKDEKQKVIHFSGEALYRGFSILYVSMLCNSSTVFQSWHGQYREVEALSQNHKMEKPKFFNLLVLKHLKSYFIKPQLTK